MPRPAPKFGWLVIGELALLAALPLRGQQAPLTHASQILRLSTAEAAQGRPVKLRGTLVHYNPDWNAIFLQDETGAAFVEHNPARDGGVTNLQPGQILEVTGTTKVGGVHCNVAAIMLSVVGTGPLPAPLDLSNTHFFSVENERLRVASSGQILNVSVQDGRPRLSLVTPEGVFLKVFLQSGSLADAASLNGAFIKFEGVLTLELTPEGRHSGQFNILVMGLDAIHLIKALPIIPITPIGERVQDKIVTSLNFTSFFA